jgi:hypothetical protein
MDCRSFSAGAVGGVAHCVNPAGINPAVVEIEQRTDRDGVIDCFVREAGLVKGGNVGWLDIDGISIHLFHETKERLFRIGEAAGFKIFENAFDERMII